MTLGYYLLDKWGGSLTNLYLLHGTYLYCLGPLDVLAVQERLSQADYTYGQ